VAVTLMSWEKKRKARAHVAAKAPQTGEKIGREQPPTLRSIPCVLRKTQHAEEEKEKKGGDGPGPVPSNESRQRRTS